jgi:hypothetical protein
MDSNEAANSYISAADNCQSCPMFCRVDPYTGIYECDQEAGAGEFYCKDDNCANECKIDYSEFDIPSNCAKPEYGEGASCPARCRMTIKGGQLPAMCGPEVEEIGYACIEMADFCRSVGPSANPCLPCSSCIEDCRAKPPIRQSCFEVCEIEDLTAGTTPITPDQMLSSLHGAKATRTSWRTIGAIAIAAIVLPLFGFLITISFIRSTSPMIGGDVEIPGLRKLI